MINQIELIQSAQSPRLGTLRIKYQIEVILNHVSRTIFQWNLLLLCSDVSAEYARYLFNGNKIWI